MRHSIIRVGLALGLAVLVIGSFLTTVGSRSIKAHTIDSAGLDDRVIASSSTFTITLKRVVGGLTMPTYLTDAADGSGRLFVLEQRGTIRVIKNGTLLAAPFLDITSLVQCCYEQGLLGLAFDPDYKHNGTFYVDYTQPNGDIVIARYVVADPTADVAGNPLATTILQIPHPAAANHNGGQLTFGPDGFLYIGTGDGGGAGDPNNSGQSLSTLLGKILRINVRGVPTYTIPTSNPFRQTAGARPEIWAYGLRNPWRFSFDRANGDLYIGDVGENCWEEIDYQPVSSHGGENYGWRLMEGTHVFDPNDQNNCHQPTTPPISGLTNPITEYDHRYGPAAVIGGYVYRGGSSPQMMGAYFFGDHEQGLVWSLQQTSPGSWVSSEQLNLSPADISSFGEDENGELYLMTYGNGEVFHIVSGVGQPPPPNLSTSTKSASTTAPRMGDVLTYTIVLRNTGSSFPDTVFVTDAIPSGLSYVPGSSMATLGTWDDSDTSLLKWNGVMSTTPAVMLSFAVTVSTPATVVITNHAVINPGFSQEFDRSATIVANGWVTYLPVIRKSF